MAEAALPPLDWWRGFRSRELTELIEEARASNLDIAAAVARIVQADAQARITGAALLPVVDLNGSATRSRASQTLAAAPASRPAAPSATTCSASLNASYEIDFWGKNRAALRAAEETAVASRFDREVVALEHRRRPSPTPISRCWPRRTGLRIARENLAARDARAQPDQAARRRRHRLRARHRAAGKLVDTQRAAIPPLEQTLRQNTQRARGADRRARRKRVRVRGGSTARHRAFRA